MSRRGESRQVQRREQARGRREHTTDRIDHDRMGSQVALEAPLNHGVDRRVGVDGDTVTGVVCAHHHCEVQGNERSDIAEALTHLMKPGDPRIGAHDWLDRFLDPL